MACHVVPQTTTQIANSCQVLKRCIGCACRSGEGVARLAAHAVAQRALDAFDDDRVHRERDRAAHARVGAVPGSTSPTAWPAMPVAGSTSGIEQRAHGLTSFSRTGALGGGEDDLVEVVLAVRIEAAEDEVGTKARQRDRRLRRRSRGAGSLRRATRSRRRAAGSRPERRWRASMSPVHLRSARRGASGSKRARRSGAAEEIAEPLRAQGAHVVGGDAVAPDLDLGALLDPIDRDVHGQHAGRAQDQLVRLQRRLRRAPCAAARAGSRTRRPDRRPSRRGRGRGRSRSARPRAARLPAHDLTG